MRHRNTLSLVAFALIVAVSSTAAQQRQGGMMHRQGESMMMGQGAGEMGQMLGMLGLASPEQILAQREALGLTGEQVARLTELQAETDATVQEATASHERHATQLHEALAGDTIDRNAVLMHMEAAHAAKGTAHRVALQAALTARDILTAEQRATLRDLLPQHGMGQGMMGGQGMRGRHHNQ